MSIAGFKLEDDLNFLANGRRPQYFGKWKLTSIFWQMEDTYIFGGKMEDDLNSLENGRRPQFINKIEDNLNFKENGRRPQF